MSWGRGEGVFHVASTRGAAEALMAEDSCSSYPALTEVLRNGSACGGL